MKDDKRLKMLEYPQGCIDVVIDTDAATEVDDPFAIAYALLSPDRLSIKAVYAAPFAMNDRASDPAEGMEMSYREIQNIFHLCGKKAEHIYRGCRRFGLDQNSPASEHLAALANTYCSKHPLYVLALGAAPNIANAILQYPDIKEKIVIVWLAGNDFDDTPNVYNIYEDPESARVIFDSGVPLIHIPCEPVTSHLLTSIPELEYCIGKKNPLCDYLTRIVKEFSGEPFAWGKPLWDVGAAAYLMDQNYTLSEITTAPMITADLKWNRDYKRHLIKNVKKVRRDEIFRDLFSKLRSAPDKFCKYT